MMPGLSLKKSGSMEESYDLFQAMSDDAGIELKEVRVDGGAANNNFLLQFLAGISGSRVQRPINTETTAAGSAFLAGLAVDFWNSRKEIENIRRVDVVFQPDMAEKTRQELYRGWTRAIKTVLDWTNSGS